VSVAGLGAVIYVGAIWNLGMADTVIWSGTKALALAVLLLVFARGQMRPAACGAALLCLTLLELYPVATATFASKHDKSRFRFVSTLTDNRDIVEFLRREPAPRRLVVNDADLPTNFSDWHGFHAMEGYVAGVSSNLLQYGRHTKAVQDLF